MSNKTILISNSNIKNNDSLTSFNQVRSSSYDNFKEKHSSFKRNRMALNNQNDYEISFNPFLSSASSIFKYILQLENINSNDEANNIREDLIAKVNHFNEVILKHEIDNTEILVTRYLLCTFIDEFINGLYNGNESELSNNSILSVFHNETYGGENFFHLLDKFLKAPAKYIHILELMYICMSLGFEGKYKVIQRGEIELNNIKESLFRQIKIVQGRDPLTFYTIQEHAKERYRLFDKVSYWLLFLLVFLLISIVYLSLTFALDTQNDLFINLINSSNEIITKVNK